MTGLILKDLHVMKDSLKVYLFIFLIYGYLGIVEGQVGLMYAMVFITSVVLPVTSISYDERSRWDRLACTMPVSRKEIVYSKYLLSLILLLSSSAVVGIALLAEDKMLVEEKVATGLIMVALSLFYQAIMIPVILKTGSEKGRIILMGICFVPIIIMYILSRFEWFRAFDIEGFMLKWGSMLPYVAVAIVVVIYLVSIKTAVKIYTGKDL